MKLLFVTPGRLPVPATKGGAVETLIDLLIEYNEEYLQQELVVASVYDAEAKERSSRYKYTKFNYLKMGKLFTYATDNHLLPYRVLDRIFSYALVRKLKKEKQSYSAIIVQNEVLNGSILKKHIPGKYIYHGHNSIQSTISKNEKQFLSECDIVIMISNFLKKQYEDICDLDNTKTVYNGVDTELFSVENCFHDRKKIRDKLGFKDEDIVVVFAGRIVPEKGIEELLTAFMALPEQSNVKLMILGASFFGDSKDNPFFKKMQSICKEKSDRIVFTGYINHKNMPAYYSAADIGCIPSMWDEPFGLSAAEQMAMELPVITTDAGALPEIVDHTCGMMVKRDSEICDSIKDAILSLSNNVELRKRMGTAGRNIILQKFSRQFFAEKWYEVIEAGVSEWKNI